jgi:hypothetical protein
LPAPEDTQTAAAPASPQDVNEREWQEETERLRVQREIASLRLELALLRLGETWRKANFNPNQPRVPAGNPDGGQWTGEGGHTDFSAGERRPRSGESVLGSHGRPYYEEGGHHEAAKGVYKKWNLRPETRRVFDKGTTGAIPKALIRSTPDGVPVGHFWNGPNGAHGQYNKAIRELSDDFLARHKIRPEQMTPDHAREFLREIRESQDPRIRDYNNALRTLRRIYRLRTGRGTE